MEKEIVDKFGCDCVEWGEALANGIITKAGVPSINAVITAFEISKGGFDGWINGSWYANHAIIEFCPFCGRELQKRND